jgi:hypothetical protein
LWYVGRERTRIDQVSETHLGNVRRGRHPVRTLHLGQDVINEIPKHGEFKVPLVKLTDVRIAVIIGASRGLAPIKVMVRPGKGCTPCLAVWVKRYAAVGMSESASSDFALTS